MEQIDLSRHSKQILEAYEKVVGGDPAASYVVYSVGKDLNLEVTKIGDGSLEEFVEHFEDGVVQFGLSRVTVSGSDVRKNLLLGWCPDSAPSKSRLSFASNFANVSKVLNGYHVQITARDQDDLDVDEFLLKIGAAAGARYSGQGGAAKSKPAGLAAGKPAAKPAPVFKPKPKPSVPTSTGKPIGLQQNKPASVIKPAPVAAKPAAAATNDDDEWDGEKEIEERDFEKQPLENVPSAYKPSKVNMAELRKQKSDTVTSHPRSSSLQANKEEKEEVEKSSASTAKPVSERLSAFNESESSDGRLTSLPKPKVGNSVASRFTHSVESSSAPKFGSKPSFSQHKSGDNKSDKVAGGFSRNFASEGGKTPAQLWAEKRGKFKSVSPEAAAPSESEAGQVTSSLTKASISDDKDDEEPSIINPSSAKKNFSSFLNEAKEPEGVDDDDNDFEDEGEFETKDVNPAIPARNIPPPAPSRPQADLGLSSAAPAAPAAALPARNLPPPPVRTQDKAETLPARNLPPSPAELKSEVPAPTPLLPSKGEEPKAETSGEGPSAVAEYDYEKDEDNEIEFAEGDVIVEIEFVDEEWWSGKHSKTGEIGLFPASYVSLQNKGTEDAPVAEDKSDAVVNPDTSSEKPSAIAEYDYEKDEENEIGFSEGDLIVEIDFVDDDWWSGKHSVTGEVGLFPANYVQLKQ